MSNYKARLCKHCGEKDVTKFDARHASECKACNSKRKLKWRKAYRDKNHIMMLCERCGVEFRKTGNRKHCSSCVPIYKSERATDRATKWNNENIEKRRINSNKYARNQIEAFGDNYVLCVMAQNGFDRNTVPQSLVEAYRANMKLRRTIKERI